MNLPNKLTLLRIILVPVFIVLYLTQIYIPACVVFAVACITDMLDGRIARKYNLVTNFGKIMDPLADKILVYSAFCLFVEKGVVPGWMFIIILFREFAIAGMRTVAASEGTVIAAAMSGKIKTVLQMFTVGTLIVSTMAPWITVLGKILLWASLIMTVVSGVEYIYKNRKVFTF